MSPIYHKIALLSHESLIKSLLKYRRNYRSEKETIMGNKSLSDN